MTASSNKSHVDTANLRCYNTWLKYHWIVRSSLEPLISLDFLLHAALFLSQSSASDHPLAPGPAKRLQTSCLNGTQLPGLKYRSHSTGQECRSLLHR